MNVYEVTQRLLSFFDLYSKPVYVSILIRDENDVVIGYKDVPVKSVGCFSDKTTININASDMDNIEFKTVAVEEFGV